MNIENIKEGQVFKNYKELCVALGIKPKTSNSKKAQLKEMNRRFVLENGKERHSLVVTKIHNEILPKQENQGNLPIYIQYMELLLLRCLQEEESKKLLVSNVKLAEKLKMIHSDYNVYYERKKELSDILNVDMMFIHDFMSTTSSSYVNAIKTILKRLESRSIILYETRWKTIEKKKYIEDGKIKQETITRFATDEEKDSISKIRYDILQNYGGTMQHVYKNGSLQEFNRLYTTRLQYELGINDAFKVYDININKNAVETEYYKTMKELMDNTKNDDLYSIVSKMWAEKNEDRLNNRQAKAIEKINGNKELSHYDSHRISPLYKDSMKVLNNALIVTGVNKPN